MAPALLSGLYLGVIAADQYETEARFIVNKAGGSSLEGLGALASLTGGGEKDAHLLQTYIQSRSILVALEENIGFRGRAIRILRKRISGLDWMMTLRLKMCRNTGKIILLFGLMIAPKA